MNSAGAMRGYCARSHPRTRQTPAHFHALNARSARPPSFKVPHVLYVYLGSLFLYRRPSMRPVFCLSQFGAENPNPCILNSASLTLNPTPRGRGSCRASGVVSAESQGVPQPRMRKGGHARIASAAPLYLPGAEGWVYTLNPKP